MKQSAYEFSVESGQTERQYLRDLWVYRELFLFLAWRDILVRYKQTVIGIAWAVIRPFLTMVVFTIIFGRLARMPADGRVPYAIMVYAATLPWQFFSSALTEASGSLIGNANLISKVYFPRLIVPAGTVITSFVDSLIAGGVMILLMWWYHWWPDWRLITLPLFMVLAFIAATGPALFLSALNVRFRDFRYVVPFLTQFGLYVSPVGFSSSIVPERWRSLYACNPMVGVIDGFRWALLRGQAPINWLSIALSIGVSIVLLIMGISYFRKVERTFADVI